MHDPHAPGEAAEPLLQAHDVIVEFSQRQLLVNVLDALLNGLLVALAADDNGVFRRADHLVAPAQHVQGGVLQKHAQFLGHKGAAGENGHVLQQAPLPVPKAGGLGADHHEFAPDPVHDDGGQSLRFDLIGNHKQGPACFHHLLHDGQHVLHTGDLPVGDEHVGVLQHGLHALGVCDHMGGEIPPVKLHALHDLAIGLHARGIVQADDPLGGKLFHGVGDQISDLPIVGGDIGHPGIVLPAPNGLGQAPDRLQSHLEPLLHAFPQEYRVGPRLHAADPLLDHALGEDDGGGGAIAHQVVGLAGHGADQLSAHVLKGVAQQDLLGDGHPVVGHQGRAEMPIQHHVPAAGPQGHPGHVGELVHTPQQGAAGFGAKQNRIVHCFHLRCC